MVSRTALFYFGIATTVVTVGAYAIFKPSLCMPNGCKCAKMFCFRKNFTCGRSNPVNAFKSSEEWVNFEVVDNSAITHNTHLVTMKLPVGMTKLGLIMNSCLLARMKTATGEYHIKPYTPISSEEEIAKTGIFSLLVKKYPNGTLSRHICELQKGDILEARGPIPKINLEERSSNGEIATLEGVKRLAMIAGGTGITPMLQAADYILRSTTMENSPKISLIAANDSSEDILAAEQLGHMVKSYPDRIEVHHVLRNGDTTRDGAISGLVTVTVLKQLAVTPQETQKVFVCGPPPMMTAVCGPKAKNMGQGQLEGILADLGFTADQVYKF